MAKSVHERYRATLPTVAVLEPTFAPGMLALLFRPKSNKLFVRSTGPYLVLGVKGSTVVLQNLATGITMEKHKSNMKEMKWHNTLDGSG